MGFDSKHDFSPPAILLFLCPWSLLKVKEQSEKVALILKIQKTKIMASGLVTSWQIDGETVETMTNYFSGPQNH